MNLRYLVLFMILIPISLGQGISIFDLNDDGIIDLEDIYIIGRGFGSSDPDKDFNSDNKVDFYDMILAARQFGKGSCIDADGDGYGNTASTTCAYPEQDCDDSNMSINPTAVEICGNDVDEDCDGTADACDNHGFIANSDYDYEKTAATLYFPGIPRDESIYTAHPLSDERGYEINDIDRQLDRMKELGINTVIISYFGTDYADGSGYQPMDASEGNPSGDITAGYIKLVERIEEKGLLFLPLIEVSDQYQFFNYFPEPTFITNMNSRIDWWMQNFRDSDAWLQIYDMHGNPRHAIYQIEAILLDDYDPIAYREGFRQSTDYFESRYGVKIGFILDPTRNPPESIDNRDYGPLPSEIAGEETILMIMPWDITADGTTDSERHQFALSVLEKWSDFPLVSFVTPGYDVHLSAPQLPGPYGMTDEWREEQKELVLLGNSGVFVGPWNGWIEYYHVTCSIEELATNLKWADEVIDMMSDREPDSSGWESECAIVDPDNQNDCDTIYPGTVLTTINSNSLCLASSQEECDLVYGMGSSLYISDYPWKCLGKSQFVCDEQFGSGNTEINPEGYCIPITQEGCDFVHGPGLTYFDEPECRPASQEYCDRINGPGVTFYNDLECKIKNDDSCQDIYGENYRYWYGLDECGPVIDGEEDCPEQTTITTINTNILCSALSQEGCDNVFGIGNSYYDPDYPWRCMGYTVDVCHDLFGYDNTWITHDGFCIPKNDEACLLIRGEGFVYVDDQCISQ